MRNSHQSQSPKGGVPHMESQFNQFLSREEMPLLEFIMRKLNGISRTKAKAILTSGGVLVDKQPQTKFNFLVQPDMLVEVSKHPRDVKAQRYNFNQYFTIVYEDRDIIVVDKADEVLSMGVGHNSLNMKTLLDQYLMETHQRCRAHVVHRLDTRTSGLMVYAKSVEAQQLLIADWHKTIIDRRYVAVVEGQMSKEEGHVESWLLDTPSMKVVSSPTDNGGKWASTDWRLLDMNENFSLVELHLHTGRKNQIRVHMQVLHHPIVGDRKYGSITDGAKRLCLHAFRLAFHHPYTQEPLYFETPFPDYFISFFRKRTRRTK